MSCTVEDITKVILSQSEKLGILHPDLIDETRLKAIVRNRIKIKQGVSIDGQKELFKKLNKDEVKVTQPSVSRVSSLKVGDTTIRLNTVSKTDSKPLAWTSVKTKEVFMQEGLTKQDVLSYLNTETATDEKLKDIVDIKAKTNELIKTKTGVDLVQELDKMTDGQIRKFLALHEYRHVVQVNSDPEFKSKYMQDPVKYESDANMYAMEYLGLIPEGTVPAESKVKNGIIPGIKGKAQLEIEIC